LGLLDLPVKRLLPVGPGRDAGVLSKSRNVVSNPWLASQVFIRAAASSSLLE
jgi:hypothetical protein